LVNTGLRRLRQETFRPILVDKVIIDQEDDGDGNQAPVFRQEPQEDLQPETIGQCPLGRFLDDRAVGQGVGKRYSQFNQVRTAFLQIRQDGKGGRHLRIAGHDEGDQGRPALLLYLTEFIRHFILYNTLHSSTPVSAATVFISLSPRPEMFTTISLFLESRGASRRAQARAWALSRAGMFPSFFDKRTRAPRASASVTVS